MTRAILAFTALAACHHSHGPLLRSDQVNTQAARQMRYLESWGQSMREELPGDLRHELIIDEAMLTTAASETCFHLVERTSAQFDEPFAQLEMRCYSDQGKMQVEVRDEKMAVRDYEFQGTDHVLEVEGVTPTGMPLSIDIQQSSTKLRKVVEREGEICCAARSPQWAGLKVCSNAFAGPHNELCEEFEWTLQR